MARSASKKKSPATSAKTKAAGKAAAPRVDARPFTPAPPEFTRRFYAHVMAEDLALFSAEDRQRIAASMWALAHARKPGTVNLRLFNPSRAQHGWTVDHTVLEVVNDDMPFLVDSIASELQRRGLRIHFIAHPILPVRRDAQGVRQRVADEAEEKNAAAESFIHVQFDHCLDPDLLRDIESSMRAVLKDVRAAVEDWGAMRARLQGVLNAPMPHLPSAEREAAEEAKEFLRWLDSDNFTFLGYREIDLGERDAKNGAIKIIKGSGLGILRDDELRVFGGLRDLKMQSHQIQNYVRQHSLLVVTKTNLRARVHRAVPMDALFIRRFDADGNVAGEQLLVGLFTSQSYSQSPHTIPILRRKIEYVAARSGLDPRSHDGKTLSHILHNYPYDELFQISQEELFRNALGILQLQERARTALFVRHDPFDRFVTALIYVPRDSYTNVLRGRIQKLLETTFHGQTDAFTVRIDNDVLARLFVIISVRAEHPRPDPRALQNELRALCRSWSDRLHDELVAAYGEARALELQNLYADAFTPAYRESFEPTAVMRDIENLQRCRDLPAGQPLADLAIDENGLLHLKLIFAGAPTALSDVLPLLENMGFRLKYTRGPYEARPRGNATSFFIHEFVGEPAQPPSTGFDQYKPLFEEALLKGWLGETENDSFSTLTLRTGMDWRESDVMRAFARYLRQLRIPYSQKMMADTLLTHPQLAQQICALFLVRHDPDFKGNRAARMAEITAQLTEGSAKIDVLEEDRIIRRYINLVQASLRTNYFQRQPDGAPKPYFSIKFDSRQVDYMPLPKPMFEIFVTSVRMEAIHLRGGKVARGGIRWSDRRDDFRNEILGLMKAQMVKNSVIVPVGSKGGFIVKKPPAEADKYQAEGIACYRMMMQGMLDITDNRRNGKILPPPRVVRHDGDDPYLVVAADKGTAKFSDIANGIAREYGFWLDDAFASGGSAGYDHKHMGITARGAWEAVKRHFREMGKDIQSEDFTVVGVGDMSGDVFGNGMLQSKHTRLLGAVDHRHIFCDPNPDAAISYVERKRLFDLPRSSWADYDAKKISKGGGVFARNEKIIKLTPEIRKTFDIAADSLTPGELVQAMLKSRVDLLYFGGIGTFVKATTETHDQVGDRSTDSMRVDAADLRAAVVGEGANLGLTQRARIEYALKGGRINTDAIDNSAGVDTSDHEVNIKILLQKVMSRGALTLEARNKLLASMTDDVGRLVLRDNRLQTQALSLAEAEAADLLPLHIGCMDLLEKFGLLNRAVEFLPEGAALAERQRAGRGLTRPELAVLLAYAKLHLYQQILDSGLPDDPYMQGDLTAYFPPTLQNKYAAEIARHQLRREIIATTLTNSIVNRGGSHFVLMMEDRTGKSAAQIVRAYVAAREAFGLRVLWAAIEALDNKVPAPVQIEMILTVNRIMEQAVLWFLKHDNSLRELAGCIATYRKGIAQLDAWLEKNLTDADESVKKSERQLRDAGVPVALARNIARLPLLGTALDLTELTETSGRSMDDIAGIFFGIGRRLGFDWLMEHGTTLAADTPRQRAARGLLLRDLTSSHKALTMLVVGKKGGKRSSLAEWMARNAARVARYDALLAEWRATGTVDLAMLTLASRQVQRLAEGGDR